MDSEIFACRLVLLFSTDASEPFGIDPDSLGTQRIMSHVPELGVKSRIVKNVFEAEGDSKSTQSALDVRPIRASRALQAE